VTLGRISNGRKVTWLLGAAALLGAWFGGAYFQARKAQSEVASAEARAAPQPYEPRGNDCVANHQCRFDEVCLRMPLPFYRYLDDIRAGGDGFQPEGRCALPRPGESFGKIRLPQSDASSPEWDFDPKRRPTRGSEAHER